jgi:hypothetical protein
VQILPSYQYSVQHFILLIQTKMMRESQAFFAPKKIEKMKNRTIELFASKLRLKKSLACCVFYGMPVTYSSDLFSPWTESQTHYDNVRDASPWLIVTICSSISALGSLFIIFSYLGFHVSVPFKESEWENGIL